MSVGAFMAALYTKLTAVQTAGSFYAAVSGNINLGHAQEEPAFPYLTYFPLPGEPLRHFGGPVSLDVTVQMDLWGSVESGPKALQDIEEKLYSLLEGVALAPSGFDRGIVTFTTRGGASIDEDCWRVSDEIRIQGTDF